MPFPMIDRSATYIVLKEIPSAGGRRYLPGDVFPWRRLETTERRMGQLINQGTVGAISEENLKKALARRAPDAGQPQGLTEDGLKAIGIDPVKVGFKKAKAGKGSDNAPKPADDIHRERYRLAEQRRGNLRFYDVFDLEGGKLNEGMLNGMKKVDAFIDDLEAERARVEAEKANAGGEDDQTPGGEDETAEGGSEDDAETSDDAAEGGEDETQPEGDQTQDEATGGDAEPKPEGEDYGVTE